jgi:integrase/recombinase XerD
VRTGRAATDRSAARRFLGWCESRGRPLHRILPADVRAYLDTLTTENRRDHHGRLKPASKAMQKLHLTAIRKLFDKLVVRHVIILNPAASVRGPKHAVSQGVTPATSPKSVERMLAEMDTSNLVRLRDACIIGTLAWTAARAGAVAGLRRGDYFSDGTQFYLRFHEKGGKPRTIPVRHDLQKLLEEWLERTGMEDAHPDTPLFPTAKGKTQRLTEVAMTGKDIANMARRRYREAGLPPKLTAHSLRATTATSLIEQGVPIEDVQELLGHADPRTTKLYDHSRREVTRNIVERIPIRGTE